MEARRFYLAGQAFNAQDVWLIVFLLASFAFGLLFLTSWAGRVWCGWGCPQTVFLEGIFRPIERLIEGNATQRRQRDASGWNARKLLLKVIKQIIYVSIALILAHWALAFFVPVPMLASIIRHGPAGHGVLFTWAMGLTALIWFNFAWFREQLCIIVCPYGRLQSVLLDKQSLIIGYDEKRGEPRGKKLHVVASDSPAVGDCVDCHRCVAVCPTGIDIRRGAQMECIGCAQCIDACDEVMDRLERPRGLVRYDSLAGFESTPKQVLRPRLFIYAGLSAAAALAVFLDVVWLRTPFEANLLREGGTTYVLDGTTVRDQFELHLVNKHVEPADFELSVIAPEGMTVVLPQPHLHLGSLESLRTPIFATANRAEVRGPFDLNVRVRDVTAGRERTLTGHFIGPPNPPSN